MMTATVPAEWQDVTAELQQVFVEGEQALRTHRQGLERVFRIGHAFAAMQQEAMRRSHSNNPIGKRYNEAWDALTHPTPELTKVNKTDRSQYVWCYEHRPQLEAWWPTLADNQRDRWGHPDTIKKQYLKAHGEELPAKAKAAPKPGIRDEVTRLQEALDAAQRKLQLAQHSDIDWTIQDEEVLAAKLVVLAEASTRPGTLLRVFQKAADRLRHGQPPARRGKAKRPGTKELPLDEPEVPSEPIRRPE